MSKHGVPCDLARTGFVARGCIGNGDMRHQRLQPTRHVALRDLTVVDIELQCRMREADRFDHRRALLLRPQEKAGDAARVDRLSVSRTFALPASSAAHATLVT